MSHQSGSSHLQALLESAYHDYEDRTGITLAAYAPEQPKDPHPADCIITLPQDYAQAFGDSQGSDKLINSINGIASALCMLSTTVALGDTRSLPLLPGKAICIGLANLLAVAKGINTAYDSLLDFLDSVEPFSKYLEIYTKVPPSPAMDEIVVNLIVELLATLALATKELNQGRQIKSVKKLIGEKQVGAVLQRLERLSQEEARTTALQTFEVVRSLVQNMRSVMGDGKASMNTVWDTLENLHQMTSDINKLKRENLRQDIRRWLRPPDPRKNHNTACGLRYPGTAAWFVQGNAFSDWKWSGSSYLLWVQGKLGAGKSVLCSKIIEDIDAMRKCGLASLAFFYHDFREAQKKDLRGLLSSVLIQLCDQSDPYHYILSDFYSAHYNNGEHRSSNDALVRCLKTVLQVPGQAPVFLIIDALDECPDTSAMPSPRAKVLMFMKDLIDLHLPNLRICLTSRPEPDIRAVLEPLTFRFISLHDEVGQREDIKDYIKSVVHTNRKMRRWSPELKQLVIDDLTKRAEGSFHWVSCQLGYLSDCVQGRIRYALHELPATIEETYERTLREIEDNDQESAHRLLQCVSVVSRPLRVEELAEFLAFSSEARPVLSSHMDQRPKNPLEVLLSTCSTLLTSVNDGGSRVIQFAHFSVKEYLASTRFAEGHTTISNRYHISTTPAHTLVAQACLGVLLQLDSNVTSDNLQKFPLAHYAAQHWIDHARFEGVSQNVEEGAKQLFDRNRAHLSIWVWMNGQIEPFSRKKRPSPTRGTPLHYAAFCGLDVVTKFLATENPQDMCSRRFQNDSTPLHLASRGGHVDCVRILLDSGADTTAQDNDGLTPLHWALREGHIDCARLFLEHGIDPRTQDKHGWTPLHLASEGGHVDCARLLIEHGADPTAQDMDGWTPLHRASEGGHVDCSRLLIEHGLDATAQDVDGWTPLHWASEGGHVDGARLLMEHGVNPTAQDKHGSTPLHWASVKGHVDSARLLIEHGADPTAQNKDGWTPLHWASRGGHVGSSRLLIEHGADPTTRDMDGSTPLHRAAHYGHLDIVRTLFGYGADANAQDNDGCTPLHLASQCGRLGVVSSLFDYDADVGARDNASCTPLHQATQHGYLEVARVLLEHGTDINARDRSNWTPLHAASQNEHLEVVQLLLERGADAHALDYGGWSPLQLPSQNGHLGVVRILLEHGADANTSDNSNWTPLHGASQQGHLEIVRVLLEHDADSSFQDDSNQTPLHLASRGGYLEIVQLLVEHNADIHVRNEKDRTAFQEAFMAGHDGVVQLLLKHGAEKIVE